MKEHSDQLNALPLSTSCINRLLRPLRTRCTSLAVFAANTRSQRLNPATYSSRCDATGKASDTPPLAILSPPQVTGSRIYFDKDSPDGLEMSKKVYGVRDCFRDILLKTTGRKRAQRTSSLEFPRVMSLAAMCAIVVGDNIESSVGSETAKEIDGVDVTEDIYEAIPVEYRRYALISHALSLIQNTNFHHPTLLNILLDLTLDHNLSHESNTLLRSLIFVAFESPSPSNLTPRICHPAHGNFLLDLRLRWHASGLSDNRFYETLIEVLAAVQSPEAWASKAVHRLARLMPAGDFPAFMRLISACSSLSAGMSASMDVSQGRGLIPTGGYCPVHSRLRRRFLAWMDMALDVLLFRQIPPESDDQNTGAVLEYLMVVLETDYHSEPILNSSEIDIQGAVLSLATCCLSAHPRISQAELTFIACQMRRFTPQTSTYASLVARVFSQGCLSVCQSWLEKMTSALRSHGLIRLEASLLASALRQVELPASERFLDSCVSDEEIREYRLQLIELVDDAEHRFFGINSIDTHLQSSHGQAKPPLSDDLRGSWKRDPIMGCWVSTSEVPMSSRKKRKLGQTPRFSRLLRHRGQPSLVGNSKRWTTRRSLGHSARLLTAPSPRRGRYSCPDSEASGGAHRHQKFCFQVSPVPKTPTFESRLAVALSNRATLHNSTKIPSSISSRPSHQPDVEDDDNHPAILPSDDSLDLFACASSSPARR